MPSRETSTVWHTSALLAGPLAALAVFLLLPREVRDPQSGAILTPGLVEAGRATLAAGAWMAIWWITEAVPLEGTSLLPLIFFPAAGIATLDQAAAPYAKAEIFFFMGGMFLGTAMEHWGLPKRFALSVLGFAGSRPDRLVAAAMTATAIVSMWVNNTSTTVTMLPIGLSLVKITRDRTGEADAHAVHNFATCMVLGIAYAATIGGIGTLFGTAPNIALQTNIGQTFGVEISFWQYAKLGLPIMILYLPLAWFLLCKVAFPIRLRPMAQVAQVVQEERAKLGPMSRGEKTVLAVLSLAMVMWVFNEPINLWLKELTGRDKMLPEPAVAILATLVLFATPVDLKKGVFALDWPTANKIHWGVLLLFGGGLTLAEAMKSTGVTAYLGTLFNHLNGLPPWVVLLAATTLITCVTEVASNTAVATTFLPIAAAVRIDGLHPFILMFAVCMSCSYAYMMPMGTPPNAMAFATGQVSFRQMCRVGLLLNIVAIALITAFFALAAPHLMDLPDLGK